MFDTKNRYKTRDGAEVVLLEVDGPNKNYPITGRYKDVQGRWHVRVWGSDGRFHSQIAREHHLDLIEVPETSPELWFNLYKTLKGDYYTYSYPTEQDAFEGKSASFSSKLVARFSVKDIKIGQGLREEEK